MIIALVTLMQNVCVIVLNLCILLLSMCSVLLLIYLYPNAVKGFFKHWWDEELSLLKEASVGSNKAWKAIDKRRYGPIFERRRTCRLRYRKQLKESQKMGAEVYTNELHDALMMKNNTAFWNCWRSKLETVKVDGTADPCIIAEKFAVYFKASFSCNDPCKAESLKQDLMQSRSNYHSLPITEAQQFDTELVNRIISTLKLGKACDIDGLSAEHLKYCHPCLPYLLLKLFQLMLLSSYIPAGFR